MSNIKPKQETSIFRVDFSDRKNITLTDFLVIRISSINYRIFNKEMIVVVRRRFTRKRRHYASRPEAVEFLRSQELVELVAEKVKIKKYAFMGGMASIERAIQVQKDSGNKTPSTKIVTKRVDGGMTLDKAVKLNPNAKKSEPSLWGTAFSAFSNPARDS